MFHRLEIHYIWCVSLSWNISNIKFFLNHNLYYQNFVKLQGSFTIFEQNTKKNINIKVLCSSSTVFKIIFVVKMINDFKTKIVIDSLLQYFFKKKLLKFIIYAYNNLYYMGYCSDLQILFLFYNSIANWNMSTRCITLEFNIKLKYANVIYLNIL